MKKALIVPLLMAVFFCGCVQENSVSKLPTHIDGVEGELVLDKAVSLPVDQEAARMLNNASGCMCKSEMFYSGGYWVIDDTSIDLSCQFKVDRKTGEIICVRVY